MNVDYFQVDAFAARAFEGNPAGVCPLDVWLDDALMQSIAAENNLAETAFFVAEGDDYRIRWFTPKLEVDLCGHATLATAAVLYEELDCKQSEIRFHSRSGPLGVSRSESGYTLNFPLQEAQRCEVPQGLQSALGITSAISDCRLHEDYLIVIEDEAELRGLQPDFATINKIDARGVIVTSPAAEYDFVSRFFAPQVGIDEDPVTGSSFTKLAPYWAQRLQQNRLQARQVSRRGGDVQCEVQGDRVLISGHACCVLRGTFDL
ncbi:MAG: PhzF family phenazine biosynthesis protein [Gammaproteobacteria bacterium]|nr:PhzF family phenazine biosynthesis protein [Gammaproteobacteria bacterium]